MLTTHQIVRNATSLFWPSLLVLIAWYSISASLRALFDFGFRLYHRRKVTRRLAGMATPLLENAANTTPMYLPNIEERLHGLQGVVQESLLLGRQATPARIGLSFLEGVLFAVLAVFAMYGARPALQHMGSLWWVHVIGVIFFLCFILRARRFLLLIPLTFLVWGSWEIFSFITSFEKTLEATTVLASIHVLEKRVENNEARIKIRLTFRGKNPQEIILNGQDKLYFEGKVYRVSTEVLLFGGKNIATVDQVFSDTLPSKRSVLLVSSESVPPLYRLQNYQKSFRVALRERLAYWLWKQFFELKKTRMVNTKILQAAPCAPVQVGQRFELRLRHVGGLECHLGKKEMPKKRTPATKTKVLKASAPSGTVDDLKRQLPRKAPTPPAKAPTPKTKQPTKRPASMPTPNRNDVPLFPPNLIKNAPRK